MKILHFNNLCAIKLPINLLQYIGIKLMFGILLKQEYYNIILFLNNIVSLIQLFNINKNHEIRQKLNQDIIKKFDKIYNL